MVCNDSLNEGCPNAYTTSPKHNCSIKNHVNATSTAIPIFAYILLIRRKLYANTKNHPKYIAPVIKSLGMATKRNMKKTSPILDENKASSFLLKSFASIKNTMQVRKLQSRNSRIGFNHLLRDELSFFNAIDLQRFCLL